MSLLVVTRIHMQVSSSKPNVDKMVAFVSGCHHYADSILICHDAKNPLMLEYLEELRNALELSRIGDKVHFLSVNPWGYFVTPLNAAIQYAQDNNHELLCFQSVEYAISAARVLDLRKLLASNVLVVGPEMDGHEFSSSSGPVQLRGRTCPWNTLAIWRVSKLAVTGFPLIGDGTAGNRSIGGVEEVSAISLLQLIDRDRHEALLVRFAEGGVDGATTQEWSTSFATDAARQAYHDRKMASKDERPAAQLSLAGIPAGVVRHVVIEY